MLTEPVDRDFWTRLMSRKMWYSSSFKVYTKIIDYWYWLQSR